MLLAIVVLVVLSVYVAFFRGGGGAKPNSGSGFTATGRTTPGTTTPPASTGSSVSTSSSSSPPTRATSSSASSSSSAPKACTPDQLSVTASTTASSYPAGAKPVLALVVTNKGPQPCVQDLADAQIELRVYNGSARVWGSHDCAIQPGTSPAVLPVGQATSRQIQWTGYSSQPACAGTRTRVGAGTYTLEPFLSGHQGKSTTFSLAG